MDGQMDCKEFERLIPDFIDQKLEYLTLKRFCQHVRECPECKEELVIQFLVSEGMARLEEGDAFDLNKELDKRLAEAERKIQRSNAFLNAGSVVELLSMAAIGCFIFWIIFR